MTNDYILSEICYDQVYKESLIRYFTLSLNDSIICEIFHEQARKLPKIFDYFLILSIRSFILSLMFWQLFIR